LLGQVPNGCAHSFFAVASHHASRHVTNLTTCIRGSQCRINSPATQTHVVECDAQSRLPHDRLVLAGHLLKGVQHCIHGLLVSRWLVRVISSVWLVFHIFTPRITTKRVLAKTQSHESGGYTVLVTLLATYRNLIVQRLEQQSLPFVSPRLAVGWSCRVIPSFCPRAYVFVLFAA